MMSFAFLASSMRNSSRFQRSSNSIISILIHMAIRPLNKRQTEPCASEVVVYAYENLRIHGSLLCINEIFAN